MHIRFIDPNRLTATGMSKPVGLLEQQRRPAAGRLRHAVGHRADLEVRADRLGDPRQLAFLVERGDEGVQIFEHVFAVASTELTVQISS